MADTNFLTLSAWSGMYNFKWPEYDHFYLAIDRSSALLLHMEMSHAHNMSCRAFLHVKHKMCCFPIISWLFRLITTLSCGVLCFSEVKNRHQAGVL